MINIFEQQENPTAIISKEADTDKFQKIVSILCEKRKKLEEKENKTEEDIKNREELREEMSTFGISEFDYQKYLITTSETKS